MGRSAKLGARLLTLALALAPRAASADDDPADDVVVRGRSAGGFVSRGRLEDAPREITDAASLIEPLPGVHVRRLGADDSFATLSVRGTSSSQVAVFLAGVPLSGGADPTLDLATLPLWPGAQARVYRSFAPAALGRGSLGGTLVLDPPSPRAPRSTEVWAGIGSFGQRRLRLGDIRGEASGLRVATGLSASRSDDDFDYVDPNATARAGADVFTTRRNAGHAAASGLVSIAMPLGRDGDGAVTVTALAQGRRQELPGGIRSPTPFQQLDSSRLVSAFELSRRVGAGTLGVRGWGRREGLALRDAIDAPVVNVGGASRTDDAIVAAGASLGWKARPGTDRSSVEIRLDGSGERYAPGTWEGAVAPSSARRTNGGLALDAETRLLASRALVLAASGRADTWHDTTDGGEGRTVARPTGHVGAELAVGPAVLATHAGLLARPASFVERFGNRGAFLPQPELRPESATTIDLGGRVGGKVAERVRIDLESAVFATWADDLIVFVNTGAYGRARAENIGSARLFGLESQLRVSAWRAELRVSYTALGTENGSECRFVLGRCERPPLPGRPTNDLVVDLAYQAGPLRLRYGLDVVSGIDTSRSGADDLKVPARALHSVGARLAIPDVPGLSASLDVRNLFDLRAADYASAVGGTLRVPIGDVYQYPLPGRRLFFALRYTPR